MNPTFQFRRLRRVVSMIAQLSCFARILGFRLSRLNKLLLVAATIAWLTISPSAVRASDSDLPVSRGGRVGWARLVTDSSTWTVHNQNDPLLAAFIRTETSLNIDPTCYPVDPLALENLCAYPFIFTNNVANVRNPASLANLREYLRRGGFIYADRCVNPSFCPDQELYYQLHVNFFTRLLPGAVIQVLPDSHEIYRCYFTLNSRDRVGDASVGHSRIYGVFYGGRMVALFSNENLQCGWPNSSKYKYFGMRMIANIYVYAMTRPGEPAAAKL